MQVRGRADGYDPAINRLEEIKTHRGDVGRIPPNHRDLHRAQAETYAHLKCVSDSLEAIDAAVVYFNVDSGVESPVERSYAAAELKSLFDERCHRFLQWLRRESRHRETRNYRLVALRFPHERFRIGQRELAASVYRAARSGVHLLAQAPTGIGKTLATLFAALKSMSEGRIDKIVYLTAKTTGRHLAVEALRSLGAERMGLRVVELVARTVACEFPEGACHGEACPLAKGFYDRLSAARDAAVEASFLDRARLREIALAHGVCPYYLGQEMTRWADVIVGDFNHYFDTGAMLFEMAADESWHTAILVDEAHNLIDRARAMYSAELDRRDLLSVMRSAPKTLKRALSRIDRCWKSIVRSQADHYAAYDELPAEFVDALMAAIAEIGELQAVQNGVLDARTLQFLFDATAFTRLAEKFGDHSVFDCLRIAPRQGERAQPSRLCLRNIVPAKHLVSRWSAAHSVTLFSATLAPPDFYLKMLGLPDSTLAIDVASPFDAAQLKVTVSRGISTRFSDRSASLQPIARLIASQFDELPGNYIAFFSSFEYLESAARTLTLARPDIAVWHQARRMDDAAQKSFLDNFDESGRGGIGFAVLGGRFSEGIDLPGRKLVGAFIATLGMPQVNAINERMRRGVSAQFGTGQEFTYLYPGLRKVVQAAGRVIRTTTDSGVVHLMDDRFAQRRVLELLPAWWQVRLA